jgi:hypothetical protein
MVSEFFDEVKITQETRQNFPTGKSKNNKNEIEGVARLDDKGDFHLIIRDPKANNKAEAVKVLTYVTIRAYHLLKKVESGASRKKMINPVLQKWRVYDSNARNFLANDNGIYRDDDLYNLDKHATDEADKFIKHILDSNIQGSWKPSSARRRSSHNTKKSK